MTNPNEIKVVRHGTTDISFDGNRPVLIERTQRQIVGSMICDVDSEGRISAIYGSTVDPFEMVNAAFSGDRSSHRFMSCAVNPHGPVDGECGDWEAIAPTTAQTTTGEG